MKPPSHVLVTGGAGFIGSNFVRWVLEHDDRVCITNLDLLTYAGNLESLTDVEARFGADGEGRYRFIRGDICDARLLAQVYAGSWQDRRHTRAADLAIDAVVHFAAESHVDRSIMEPGGFVMTNVNGTLALIQACHEELAQRPRDFRFLHVSTDEVYGSLAPDDPPFTETTPLAPNSPYSASKASADFLVRSYIETFGLPAIITRCSNNYGPYQFPEKLIPLMVTRALVHQPLPVYGDGQNVRDWLHVDDHVTALWRVLTSGTVGEVYNIGGEAEVTNLDLVHQLLRLVPGSQSSIQFVTDRPGHDRRYAMDITKIRNELGWSPAGRLNAGLATTVSWYLEHRSWWERVLNEAYRAASELYLMAG